MIAFLSTLIQVVLIAAIPVCAGAIAKGVQAGAKYLASTMENDLSRKYLKEAADAISTAVTYTSQTYVDGLKKSNEFTEENQAEALAKAVEQAKSLLTAEARDFLEKSYGDLAAYLTSKIEAEVRRQKSETAASITETIELGEVRESPDVTTLAATTAAATAAAVVQQSVPKVETVTAPKIDITVHEQDKAE